jgi:uncharacterized protein (TIGR02246 family)
MLIPRILSALGPVFLLVSSCQPAPEQPASQGSVSQNPPALTDADRDAVKSAAANFDKAMLARDYTTAVNLYTEDAVLFPPNRPMVKGRGEIRKFFEGSPKFTEFEQSVSEIEGGGDLAYPWGTYRLTIMPPSGKTAIKEQGKVLAIWRKQPDGKWLASKVAWNSDLSDDQ